MMPKLVESNLRGVPPPSSLKQPTPLRHIPALDGLRGIAILLVLAYHFMGYTSARGGVFGCFFAFNRSGWVGVDLFFVLSGFLITGILLDARGGDNFFRNFYVRRALRIFPLYYLTLGCVFGLPLLLPTLQTEGFRQVEEHQAWLWLYGNNLYSSWYGSPKFVGGWLELNHLWSLAVEEHFYLFWAPVVYLFGTRRLPAACLACITGALLLRVGLVAGGTGPTAPYILSACRMDAMAAGALVAALVRIRPSGTLVRSAGILFGGCGVVLLAQAVRQRGLDHADVFIQTAGFTLLALLFAAMLILVITLPQRHPVNRTLCNPMLMSIGKYSYAIYIFHWALAPNVYAWLLPQEWFFRHLRYVPGLVTRFVLVTLVTYGLALLSWHLFEKHFLGLKRLFEYEAPPANRQSTPASAPTPELAALS